MISNEKYLDIFLNTLINTMIKNDYENLNIDQILVLRNELRKEGEIKA